jgi:hypothetical protein
MAGWEPILSKSPAACLQAPSRGISGDWRLRCVAYCRALASSPLNTRHGFPIPSVIWTARGRWPGCGRAHVPNGQTLLPSITHASPFRRTVASDSTSARSRGWPTKSESYKEGPQASEADHQRLLVVSRNGPSPLKNWGRHSNAPSQGGDDDRRRYQRAKATSRS